MDPQNMGIGVSKSIRSGLFALSIAFAHTAHAADVSVTGVTGDIADALLSASLSVSADAEGVNDAGELIAAARADYSRLVAKLYELGYFAPRVSILVDGREASGLSVLSPQASVTRIELRVTPGPQFTFGRAEVTPAALDTPLPEGFARGEVATTPIMRAAVEAQIDGWRNAGHAKATPVSQSIQANHPAREIDARFRLQPGPKLTFGKMIVETPSAVRAERIKTIAGLRPSDTYSPQEIIEAERRLRQTGAFNSVVIREAEEVGPGNTLDTIIEVADAKPRRFGFGVEVSSTEGAAISAFWLHRNIRGGAERLRFDGEIGGLGGAEDPDITLAASWSRPATLSRNTLANAEARIEQLNEPNFSSDKIDASFGFERTINDKLKPRVRFGLRFDETTQDGDTSRFRHLYLSAGITWDSRNEALNPTGGSFAEVDIAPYFGQKESADFVQARADLRAYRSVSENVVLAGRAQLGFSSGASVSDTPPELLFFSGGGGTVRGHDYQSLGATVGTVTTGGLGFVGLSGEVRYQLRPTIGVVGFLDAGYVSPKASLEDGDWHAGAGIGARYFTPIGPIRVDIAAPVSGAGSGVSLYIGIGQAF